jgi:hypothetical protein
MLFKTSAILLISPEQEDYQHYNANTQKCQYDSVWFQ